MLAALAHRQFRFFYVGTIFSSFAMWMQTFAIGWLAVELAIRDGQADRSSFYIGLLGLARLVPALLVGPFSGFTADRYDRRRVLLSTRTATAIVVAALAALVLAGQATIALVVILVGVAALVQTFEAPARLAIVPMLVPIDVAFNAISMTRATMMASSLIGPLLGGVLIISVGTGGILVVATALYALSGLGLGSLDAIPPRAEGIGGPLESLRVAVAFVRRDPTVSRLMLVTMSLTVFAGSFSQLFPAYVHEQLGAGAVELSWLVAASGFGAFVGASAVSTMDRWRRPGWVLGASALALGVSLILLGLQRTLGPALVLSALFGCFQMICFGGNGNIVQMVMPDELRGRVMAIWIMNFGVGFQVGTLLLGTVGSAIGIGSAATAAGAVVVVVALAMLRTGAIRDVGDRGLFAAVRPRHFSD